jgi:hypothetical protein
VAGPTGSGQPVLARAAASGRIRASPLPETRTITVHAFDDDRIHLAVAHLGRLKQGRLTTLCGRLAVTALSPFAAAAAASERCRTCFSKVDEQGHVTAPPSKPAKAKPSAEVIDMATRQPKPAPATPVAKPRAAAKAKPTAGPAAKKKPAAKAPAGKGKPRRGK